MFCERAGYRPDYAWTAYDYAQAPLERGRPGGRERAAAGADGSAGYRERAGHGAAHRRSHARSPRRSSDHAALHPRRLPVARVVATCIGRSAPINSKSTMGDEPTDLASKSARV
jgi:hypothetical protein